MTTERARTYMAQDARRQQLLDLGLHLFGARSYDDVSIDDIAREAEISRGLMYHYFGSKRGFYIEVVRHAGELLLDAIQPDSSQTAEVNLRTGLQGFFGFVQNHAQAYLTMMHGGLGFDDEIRTVLDDVRNIIVERMLETAPYIQSTPLVHSLARGWLGSVETCAAAFLQKGDVPVDQLIEYLGASLSSTIALLVVTGGQDLQSPWHIAMAQAATTLQLISELDPATTP